MNIIDSAFIGGKWVKADSGKTLDVINPANMQVVAQVPVMGESEALRAVDAAESALPAWRKTLGKERGAILRKLRDLMVRDRDTLAKIMILENGKAFNEAYGEVDYSISFVEWFAEEAKRIFGEILPSQITGQRLFVTKEPVGVVAAITPWNFPLAMLARKAAPALAAGCTMVVKPSEETPLSALYFAKLCQEAGVPDGVINVVMGEVAAIGEVLTSSPKVRLLTFTGSTAVGKMLAAKCAGTVKKVALELGGNAPFIVFEDADLEKAAHGLLSSKLRTGGQSCICANRIFVHEKVLDQFLNVLKPQFAALKVGDGMDPSNHVGPLTNRASVRKITGLINDAVANGAEIVYQANIEAQKAASECFIAPTIVVNKLAKTSIEETEIFGPIVSIFTFSNEEDVVKRANESRYGLASYFYSENKDRCFRVAEALEYGMVGVNDVKISSEMACFGGIKESGLGREGGTEGMLEYLESKYTVMS